jgi:hypothetical protein
MERNMSRHAFILGGTGQIGRAVANEFLSAGWSIIISHRGAHAAPADLVERGAKVVTLNRDIPGQLSRVLDTGADALIDTTAYNRDHGSQLISIQSSVGNFVVISSASVIAIVLAGPWMRHRKTASRNYPTQSRKRIQRSIPDQRPIRRGRSHWNVTCWMTPQHRLHCCGRARYMDNVPAIRGNVGSLIASWIVAMPYR